MNIEEKITRRINLDQNDGLSSFMGMAAQQTHNVYEVFYNFIKNNKPARILEIGTALGGFTQFLRWVSNEIGHPMYILSFDVLEYNWYKDIRNMNIDVRVENVFGESYNSVNQEIIDFIQQEGTTLVLCDGGYKVGEFNILSNYIKVGDFIMAHDYADNKENFDKNIRGKIWNWHEIAEQDISDACERNNLQFYNKEIFDKVAWVCKIKER